MDENRGASTFETLVHLHGKSMEYLKSSGIITSSQMKKLEQEDYGAVRISTMGAIVHVLNCDILEVLSAFASGRND